MQVLIELFLAILFIALVLFVLLVLIMAYVSLKVGKCFNYAVRSCFGRTITSDSPTPYIQFSTITVLFVIPVISWLFWVWIGLGQWDTRVMLSIVWCATFGLIGYYSAHFGTSPDRFSVLQPGGVMKIHEQETIWFNSIRNNSLFFWHWTVARRSVEVEYWLKHTMKRLTGRAKE